MRFFDYITLAYKNLSRQKSRTILTIIAITIGSLSVILMFSIIIGLRQSLMDSFKKMGAFDLVTVTRDPNSTDNNSIITTNNNGDDGKMINDATITSLLSIPNVIDATPIMSVWAKTMRLEGSDKKNWANIAAYDVESNVFTMPLLAGRSLKAADMDKIVVGSNFRQTYAAGQPPEYLIGKKVILSMENGGGTYPDWGSLPPKPPTTGDNKDWYESQPKTLDILAEIVGVADNSTTDDKQSYITIGWAKKLTTSVRWDWGKSENKQCTEKNDPKGGTYMDCNSTNTMVLTRDTSNFDKNGYASAIVKVNNTDNVEGVAGKVANLGYGATTAKNMIDQMNKIFMTVGLVLGLIGGISLFVAGIGIINTMVMATYERIREIGVMRACGATRAIIRRLFTFEAAMLGFWGGVFGMIISFGLGKLAKLIAEKNSTNLGNIPIDNIGNFPWWLVVGVIIFTTMIGLISGLYPAARAAKLNPVEALRHE
ncbi:MAG: FtsX-like permease family protein [bacterium]